MKFSKNYYKLINSFNSNILKRNLLIRINDFNISNYLQIYLNYNKFGRPLFF